MLLAGHPCWSCSAAVPVQHWECWAWGFSFNLNPSSHKSVFPCGCLVIPFLRSNQPPPELEAGAASHNPILRHIDSWLRAISFTLWGLQDLPQASLPSHQVMLFNAVKRGEGTICMKYEIKLYCQFCLALLSLVFAWSPAGSRPWQYLYVRGSLGIQIRRVLDKLQKPSRSWRAALLTALCIENLV